MAMSTNVENLILARLDRIRDELAVTRLDVGEIKLDIRELRARTGQVEHAVATLSMRTDRLSDRVERIEVRLGLADASGLEPSPMPS
jgi:chromosome segregation ATPase